MQINLPSSSFTSLDSCLQNIENNLLPLQENRKHSTLEKTKQYTQQFCKLLGYSIFALPIATIYQSIYGARPEIPPLSPLRDSDFDNLPEEVGVATAEYQVNGKTNHPNTNWAQWEEQPNTIKNGDLSLASLDHWHNRDRVIEHIKALGLNHYRFSIERSMVEPEEGQFSEEALEHYEQFCQQLLENGITPFIVLHHFSDPTWFSDKGGFEKEENIASFVNFSKQIFLRLSPYVKKWATFNEPGIYTFSSYILGDFPPGKVMSKEAGNVLHNILKAHTQTYDALKQLDPEKESEIGITHQFLRFRAYHISNPIEKATCRLLTHVAHDVVMRYFKEGVFEFKLPTQAYMYEKHDKATTNLDFLGVQYYSDPLISMALSKDVMITTAYPGQTMTNMPYRFYPQGMLSALKEASELKKPIYITETGVDDTQDKQVEYYQTIFKVASKAIQEGIDLRGIYMWTLEDNFEWNLGWQHKFGLYDFNLETGKITPKKIVNWIQGLPKKQQPLSHAE